MPNDEPGQTAVRTPPRVAICMPAFNEADGLPGFIAEISGAFADCTHLLVIVDDCSSDATATLVAALGADLCLIRNETNLGHGRSTVIGLREALRRGVPWILAADGDGQVRGADLRRVFDTAVEGNLDVVEGVRIARGDPLYRTAVSSTTRLLVRLRCGRAPADANTPVRCYRAQALERLLAGLPEGALTPNLFFSARARSGALRLAEVPIAWLPRRGGEQRSVSWQSRMRRLPSRRFVTFSIQAATQWARER